MFSVPCPPSGDRCPFAQLPMVVTGGSACETDYNYPDSYSRGQPNYQRAMETIGMEAPPPRSSCTLLQLGGLVYRGGITCAVGEFVGLDMTEGHRKESGLTVCEPAQSVSQVTLSKDKVGLRLSPEERKEKIHRYMKKRDHRNFTKRIKYTCRKTLADSRPRVRGRFVKHDERGQGTKDAAIGNHDFHKVAVKEEEMLDWDILAHINTDNSFECSWALESWM
ncbi:uncharacterized protein LOC121999905 [Zingiber officinale]|uniref:uncharacterized protein LOC121999905 n=1 Tax=Zingiber officinale TaxID=94328 RepID=UPI001C4DA449|nr:uncharacterized protein LOC121999905 [Zingiber officinale]